MGPRRPLAERFWEKVDKRGPDECWNWLAVKTPTGYGQIGVGDRPAYAHRVAYELMVGAIPPDREIDHLCRNRGCVNPAHLEVVVRRVNVLRGESPMAKQARRTHCKRGHPFDEENTYWYGRMRLCRACDAMRQRQYRKERKQR